MLSRTFLLATLLTVPACLDADPGELDPGDPLDEAEQALTSTESGWARAHLPTGSYDADPLYSYNPGGLPNRITQLGTGSYRVTFTGRANAAPANVQITAYGRDATTCKLAKKYAYGADFLVEVSCFAPSGVPASSGFDIGYVRDLTVTGAPGLAYLAYDGAFLSDSFNTSGGTNTVTRTALGRYRVTLPGQSSAASNVMVTAWGPTAARCKVVGWSSTTADVACYQGSALADSGFSVQLVSARTAWGGHGAHVWGHDAASLDYAPMSTYSYNTLTTINRAGWNANYWAYWIKYPGFSPDKSVSLATAYGLDPVHCKITKEAWAPAGTTTEVACFDAAGNRVQARYSAAFWHR